jgi:asparagine synthase (glutamine-hydrolysing)
MMVKIFNEYGVTVSTIFTDFMTVVDYGHFLFGSWPVLPFVDRKILEVLGGMPIEVMTDRRLEKELFKTKFPNLAKLPLSSNDFGASYLAPTFPQRITNQIYGNDGIWRYKFSRDFRTLLFLVLKGERRYWRGTATGFHNPGWKKVRKIAEPYLKVPLPLLDLRMVQKLMPSTDSSFLSVQWKIIHGGIDQTSSLKLLMQYAMWSNRNQEILGTLSPVRPDFTPKITKS